MNRYSDTEQIESHLAQISVGDLVIRRGRNAAKVNFVESIERDGETFSVLLVDGIGDEHYEDADEFYRKFRLLAKANKLMPEAAADMLYRLALTVKYLPKRYLARNPKYGGESKDTEPFLYLRGVDTRQNVNCRFTESEIKMLPEDIRISINNGTLTREPI